MAAATVAADDRFMDVTYNAGALRVSTAEREPVIERLKEAYADGRLDHREFDLRMQRAMTVKTRAELDSVLVDLVRPPVTAGTEAAPTGEDRLLAALAHASGYLTSIAGPLVFLLLSGGRSRYVRRHAAEALNFQITVLLVVVVTFGLGAVLWAVTWILAGIAAAMALVGQEFRHPWTLRVIRVSR